MSGRPDASPPTPAEGEPIPPRLADESRWYTEHTALLISTVKWGLLGAAAGICVGLGTRGFLWSIAASSATATRLMASIGPAWLLLPLALPFCVYLIRRFAPEARGHGTEAVIAAVHQRSGRVDWKVAPVKLVATVVTLATGGSVGKEGPAAQIGAALTSMFADLFRLSDADRRRLVICGISAGFASVFGTPISGALFGIEVLYLGRIDYSVIFPSMVAGIVGHLVCGVRAPFPKVHDLVEALPQGRLVVSSILAGIVFGLVALLLIESMRGLDRGLRRFENHPYLVALTGGLVLVGLYWAAGDRYAGLGTPTIEAALTGAVPIMAGVFLLKILATSVTLETGGSGGVVTPIFFIGSTAGAALAPVLGLPGPLVAAFGFVSLLAAAANTPIAAAVMAIELLPPGEGVYAALAAAAAFLLVGHRSVYASQKLGLSKSGGLDVDLGMPIGEVDATALRVRPGSFTERVHNMGSRRGDRGPGTGD